VALLSKYMAGKRYGEIAPYIKGHVLELGCQNATVLTNYGSNITGYCGVEKSASLVKRLSKTYPEARFVQCDLDKDELVMEGVFDCVLMLALIEHLYNQKFVMEGVVRALKPGGIVAITTPTILGNDIVLPLGAAMRLFAKSALDQHIVIYNRKRFVNLAKAVGLSLTHHHYFQAFCNQVAILEKP